MVILIYVIQILCRNLIFMPREQSKMVPYHSNFMSKVIQKFLKMYWTLGKSPTLDSNLVTEGKEKMFGLTNHKY